MQLKRGPRNHGELVAWQLCAHLRRLVWDATREGPAKGDRKYCDQIRSAARTACYLTSEGFYRTREGDFLNCLVMAHASLVETDDYLDHGVEKQYIAPVAHGTMKEAVARAMNANRRLRDSLRSQSMAKQEVKRKTFRRL
ncbi:MAG TPA: four helix bundle protein [Vicinamibacterales bacterium]|nr:four helix bundle protein [Vicinamibacterales bacterium]